MREVLTPVQIQGNAAGVLGWAPLCWPWREAICFTDSDTDYLSFLYCDTLIKEEKIILLELFDIFTGQLSLEAEKTWLQCECDRWGNKFNIEGNIYIGISYFVTFFTRVFVTK